MDQKKAREEGGIRREAHGNGSYVSAGGRKWRESSYGVSVAESRRGVSPRYFKPEYIPF
jgi:hypothetical protein